MGYVQALNRQQCQGVAADPCPELTYHTYNDIFLTKEVLMSVLKKSVEILESFKHFLTRMKLLRNGWGCLECPFVRIAV
jgi:hypothetical protein